MTTLSLERFHPRPAGRTTRVRGFFTAWSALVARSVEAADEFDRAPTTSARHKVLMQFADSGA